ncbi:hypothetical protein C9374_006831 [Naegleria lovaniensis]|uniref:Ran guanine nucleotide release factor n=1 Tax=Naegleria lovaniensis TaxID=51637 RepID=A0AA88H224_NAELO|nr:uncharacterized protein C9374_006831 [Naegleria lovaniensis]KAG2393300.1 hypothetical protein C9374_006831 [Naegleria lovaniensis]
MFQQQQQVQANGSDLVVRQLFGGAMSILLPVNYLDASHFREIPDNQEVWTDNLEAPTSSSGVQSSSCPSIIIEILSRPENVSDANITEFLFNDLADANHVAANQRLLLMQPFNDTQQTKTSNFPMADYAAGAVGKMMVEKNRGMDEVTVFLWVVRLKHIDTDILISLNDPMVKYSTSDEAAQSSRMKLFEKIIRSLTVNDWNLFA